MGLFGIAEIITNFVKASPRQVIASKLRHLMPTRDDMRRSIGPILRGSGIGMILGVLPGGGGILSSFTSYAIEKKLSRHPEQFGKGAIEGVAGPEAANNAGAQASFIPLLSLGIPSNAVMALMGGALLIQGITPGPMVITKYPELFWGIVVSMWIGNLMLLVINLPLVGIWVKLLTIPYRVLAPAVLLFCCIGTFSVNNSTFDIGVMAFFGVLGYLLRELEFDPTPLLLAFILGPMMEDNFRRAMLLSDGNPGVFVESPVSAVLLGTAVLLFTVTVILQIRGARPAEMLEEPS
jgi:TctA family transporter